mmetsp:Transcript_24701/g.43908  ORF Transcript_24701/g.43908 Transcript_24701/m.43908 type:complete len:260 (+) Transcript_24701:1011-1790(+)
MANLSFYRRYKKVSNKPKNPFEKKRFENELKIINKYGLKSKVELWKYQLLIAKLKKITGKVLRTEIDYDPSVVVSKKYNLLWFCFKFNLLLESESGLEYVLRVSLEQLLERRIQFLIVRLGMATTCHEARIKLLHKRVMFKTQSIDKPSFLVRKSNEDKIKFLKENSISAKSKIKVPYIGSYLWSFRNSTTFLKIFKCSRSELRRVRKTSPYAKFLKLIKLEKSKKKSKKIKKTKKKSKKIKKTKKFPVFKPLKLYRNK